MNMHDWDAFANNMDMENDSTLKWFDNEHHGISPKQDLLNYKAELLHSDEIELLMTHLFRESMIDKSIVPVEMELLIFKFVGNIFFESLILNELNKRILLSLLIDRKKWDLSKIYFDLFRTYNVDKGWVYVERDFDPFGCKDNKNTKSGSLLIVKSNYGRIFGAIIGETCDPFLFVLSDDNDDTNNVEPNLFEIFAPQSVHSQQYKIKKWKSERDDPKAVEYKLGQTDVVIYAYESDKNKRSSCMSDTFKAVGNDLCGGNDCEIV